MSILLSGEMEVDGNLKVTGTVESTTIDSLHGQISSLLLLIADLEFRIANMECLNTGIIPDGYCDCYGNALDLCGVCAGDDMSCTDCAGVLNGDNLQDMCGYCDNDSSNDCLQDCNGEWGGVAEYDVCGECGGDAISEDECNYVMDIEGNIYEIVQIGNQKWMAENLTTATYNDGTVMGSEESSYPYDSPNDGNLISETVCGNDCADVFGKLYQWSVIEHPGGICMEGWHVPSDNDWKELEINLGMCEGTTNPLQSSGNCVDDMGWRGTNQGCQLAGNLYLWTLNEDVNADMFNNFQFGETGFDVLPSGQHNGSADGWVDIGYSATFWTSTNIISGEGYRRTITSSSDGINRDAESSIRKFSVRCIKD